MAYVSIGNQTVISTGPLFAFAKYGIAVICTGVAEVSSVGRYKSRIVDDSGDPATAVPFITTTPPRKLGTWLCGKRGALQGQVSCSVSVIGRFKAVNYWPAHDCNPASIRLHFRISAYLLHRHGQSQLDNIPLFPYPVDLDIPTNPLICCNALSIYSQALPAAPTWNTQHQFHRA